MPQTVLLRLEADRGFGTISDTVGVETFLRSLLWRLFRFQKSCDATQPMKGWPYFSFCAICVQRNIFSDVDHTASHPGSSR